MEFRSTRRSTSANGAPNGRVRGTTTTKKCAPNLRPRSDRLTLHGRQGCAGAGEKAQQLGVRVRHSAEDLPEGRDQVYEIKTDNVEGKPVARYHLEHAWPAKIEIGALKDLKGPEIAAMTDPGYDWDDFNAAPLAASEWKGGQFGVPLRCTDFSLEACASYSLSDAFEQECVEV